MLFVLGLYHVTSVKYLLSLGSMLQEKRCRNKIPTETDLSITEIFLLDNILDGSQNSYCRLIFAYQRDTLKIIHLEILDFI